MKNDSCHSKIAEILIKENNRPIPLNVLLRKMRQAGFYNYDNLVSKTIDKMLDDGEIKRLNNSGSIVIKHLILDEVVNDEKIIGTIKINDAQNGYVVVGEEKKPRYFVHKNKLNGALDGDIVEISQLKMYVNAPQDKISQFLDAKVNKVLERKKLAYTATIKIKPNKEYSLDIDDTKFYYNVILDDISDLKNNDKILFEIHDFKNNIAYAKVQKIIGKSFDVGNDILSTVYNVGIEPAFPIEILNLADQLKIEWDPQNPGSRRDLTSKNFITIDPSTSKDFDDSIYIEKNQNGTYKLNVAIADVGHFVKYNSELAKEALKRGTSIYLADRVIPMYPLIISDDLCSINPQVLRFSMNCEVTIDQDGNYHNIDVYPAAIISKRRFSYDEVNDYYAHKNHLENDNKDIVKMLDYAKELHAILRARKLKDGYIEFDIKEPKIILDETGFPIDIQLYKTGEAQKMIEDCMIAANECVTIFALKHKIPFVYRVHDEPDQLKFEEFMKLLRRIDFKSSLNPKDLTSKKISDWLNSNQEHPSIEIARKMLLQSMSKAKYSEELRQHFGIASQNYTHFTSPIRRFPDTLVSQLFHMFIFDKDQYSDEQRNNIKKDIAEFAKKASDKEIIATKLYFDVNEMKFAEYMTKHIGEHFVGMITSINNFGAFIQLPNTIEGLMHIKNMQGDFYNYDQSTSTLVGRRTRQEFHVGDKVEIAVISASKSTRKIDFELVRKVDNNENICSK